MDRELLAAWGRLLPDRADWPAAGMDLLTRYAEPHRHYHDHTHLAETLAAVDRLTGHARNPDACRLAAWFHDAVHDPRRADNEDASAALATRVLEPYGFAPARVSEVARLVRLTASHDPGPDDPDGAVLCDADLAILAAAPERYARYVADVRQEYAHLEDAEFRRGRARVLRHLRGMGPLYRTATADRAWTASAHRNLDTELARLYSYMS